MDDRSLEEVIYVSSGSDSGISSSKPTTSLWASGKKRRVSSDQESPRKRLRKAKEPIEEVLEARGSKRKATDMVVNTDSSFSIDDSAITSVKDASGAVIVIESSDSDTKPVMVSKKRARTEEPDANSSSSSNSSRSSSNNSSTSSSSSSTSNSNSSRRSSSSSSSTSNSNSSSSNRSSSNNRSSSSRSSSSKANTVSVEDIKVLPGSFGDSSTSTPTNSQRGGNDEGLVGTVQETSEEAEEDGSDDFEDKYEQLQQLGKGGFGCVYAGTRKADGLPVAIKRIRTLVKRQSVLINGRRRSLPTEVFLMMKAAGGPETAGESAAVSLLDFYDRKGELIIVMERPVPSQDLRRYRFENKGPLEENLAKSIMKQLVDAAVDMHSKGILHRDIKLSNLLIETGSAQPRVRVIDFGCGCILSRKPYSTFSGTPAYTPPEYFTKLKYRAGPTTVWQLGSVLYEILDGARNFNTLEFCCVGVSIGNRFSEDCHDFLRACLMTNPEKRATLEQLHQHPWLM